MHRSFTTKLAAAFAAMFAITAVLGGLAFAHASNDAGAPLWIGALIALAAVTGAALVIGLARSASAPVARDAQGTSAQPAAASAPADEASRSTPPIASTEQMASSIQEIARTINAVAATAQHTASGAHQTMTTATELTRMATELKQRIGKLSFDTYQRATELAARTHRSRRPSKAGAHLGYSAN
ncbi:MAG TPA: hypothetical protein VGC42_05210 [Kofleriaceae bacterium]